MAGEINYDLCHYCGNPGMLEDEVEHSRDCPYMTNLFPVSAEELNDGLCCASCSNPFEADEHYTTMYAFGYGINVVVCLGCAATERPPFSWGLDNDSG